MQVLNKLMGPILSALLGPATKGGGGWAVHSLQHLLHCMLLTVRAFRQDECHRRKACSTALQALLTRLTGMADKHLHDVAIHKLLNDAIESLQRFQDLPVIARDCPAAHAEGCDADVAMETI